MYLLLDVVCVVSHIAYSSKVYMRRRYKLRRYRPPTSFAWCQVVGSSFQVQHMSNMLHKRKWQ